jgi:ferredoxin
MTYLVTDNCVKCKHTTCVSVCPVDCFYEGTDMLVINPDECIDCGVCEPECPVGAIVQDSELFDLLETERWTEINRKHSEEWTNITVAKDPDPEHEKWDGVKNKYEMFVENSIPVVNIK